MKSQKKLLVCSAGAAFVIIFSYFFYCVNFLISDSYTLFTGSVPGDMLPFGLYAAEDAVAAKGGGTLREGISQSTPQPRNITVKVLGVIPVKEVSINTVEAPMVYPSGECIGIKMFSKGLIVSGFTDFDTEQGICVSPGAAAGLKTGDIITAINGVQTSSTSEFTGICDSSGGNCVLTVTRGDKSHDINVHGEKCTDGHMRMGIYVKNSVAGVGTMTYVAQDGSFFGALGHGITDMGTLVPMQSAAVFEADVIDVKKGTKGVPGELIGSISEDKLIGECTNNSSGGIYGVATGYKGAGDGMQAAPSTEVTEGRASILCTVDEDDEPVEYEVRIVNVNHVKKNKSKSFSIKVTDKRLIDKTGGIVQGMSGSPVIQNGKLVGAVTHVFVNDPTRGYGIFIENMLSEAEKIK